MSEIIDAIYCQGLSRQYGDVVALDSLDLNIRSGSVFGFLGRNGAGKTTTIRLMTGLAKPTSGDAWIAGVKVTDGDDTARMSFGYLPEEPAFYTWMTPQEFLNYIGKLFGMNAYDREQRVKDLLLLTGLQDAAKRRIGGFSRGMRQRLGLAQALIHKPPVLFLDEPTSALDPAGRKDVLDLVDRLRGETTVFLSSHILADVDRVCDTVGVIQDGKLLLTAGRDELLSRYTADIVVIEFDPENSPLMQDSVTRLEKTPWISNIVQEDHILRISVSDKDRARQQLLSIIVDFEQVILRYEWLRPSLEDIFFRLSSN